VNWIRSFAPALAALSMLACSRSSSSDSSPLGDTVSEPGLFSYQAPKGWDTATSPEADYSSCFGPTEAGGVNPSIIVTQQGYQSVDNFVKSYLAEAASPTAGAKLIDKSSFETSAGVKGVRLVARNEASSPKGEIVSYVFPAKNGLLLVINGICVADDDAQFLPLFDASMKSLDLNPN